jgi:diguanylate cyclase (GGDEF)-like protein/PAS domain S-box-containing protein
MQPRQLRDVPISSKVFLAPALTLAALMLLAVVAFIGLREGKRHVHELSQGAFETFRLAVAVNDAASAVQVGLLDAILASATESDKTRIRPRIGEVEQAAARAHRAIEALAVGLGDRAPAVARLRGELDAYLAGVREVLGIAQTDPASAWIIVNEVRRSFAQVSGDLARFQAEANAVRATTSRQAIASAAVGSFIFLLVVLLTTGSSIFATLYVARSITRPIARLTGAMSELAAGHLHVAVPECDRGDEVGRMAAALQVFKEGLIEAERLNREREAARSRELEHVRRLANATIEGIVIHHNGIILEANVAFCRLVGRPDAAAVRGCPVLEFVAPGSAGLVQEWLRSKVIGIGEIELQHASGSNRPVEVLSRPFEYDYAEVTLTAVRDLSERKQAEAQIRKLAFHDALTGLPNRHLLNDRLAQALELASRSSGRVAVLCLDLDRFKFVNDLFGHDAGDRLLMEVANRLCGTVRANDTVARPGGDEFVIVQALAEQPALTAALARRIIAALSAPYEIQGQQVEIGVSIGIATYPGEGKTSAVLLKNGDTALYHAKSTGRGQYQFFAAEMDIQLRERRSLEQDLRQAFAHRELTLNFQPLYDCAHRTLEGFEALLRWSHPLRGAVSPAEFIPAAEECGLIIPLGRWVLETACAEAASWPRPWSVAVNLSSMQFRDPNLPDMVLEILARAGLPPSRLELEVTESLLISNPDEALLALTRLRAAGVRISLDDFGTGYSSLSYLRRFPFDKLKIDKSFVQDCQTNPDAAAIVSAIITLGQCLHIRVTGEGVESEAQLHFLATRHCDQAQGYLLGRPQPAGALALIETG